MDTFNQVVPGKVNNEGIVSREDIPASTPEVSSPAHYPDLAMSTPRGEVKRVSVATSNFTNKFGDTTDPYGYYYNPVAFAIQKLAQAGQASFGFKRLVNNDVKARTILGVAVFKEDVPNYKRDRLNDYEYDASGNPVPNDTTPTLPGYFVCPGVMLTKDNVVGKAKVLDVTSGTGTPEIPAGTIGKFYPLFEGISGIGDAYNSGYMAVGHSFSTNWSEIARFVMTYGAYPFTMNVGNLLENGSRIPSYTTTGTADSTFTLFPMADSSNVIYSVKAAIDAFTGNNVNRPVTLRDAPYSESFTYSNNINTVATMLYAAEYVDGTRQPPVVQSKKLPRQAIMNPLDLVDHLGKPYHHIVFGGNFDLADTIVGTRISMNHYLQVNGGIIPFADNEGKFPAKPDSWIDEIDGVWVEDNSDPDAILSHKQCWEMNQIMYLAWLAEYQNSLTLKDVIRNRTSFIWDLGWKQEIKDYIAQFLSKRKDLLVVPCATEYLVEKTQDQIYSTATMLNTRLTMIPESDVYKAPACRAAINLWDSRYINEPTFARMSLNIETMYAFALAGGNAEGKIYAEFMPDYMGNRILRIAHDPQVQFEDDDPAANNLINGSISVTPINETGYCRAALPSVYPTIDSVLKDFVNGWKCVCVEKILQDLWIAGSQGSQGTASGYISYVKDNGERLISTRLGSVIGAWEINPSFKEAVPNAKSTMYSVTKLYLGKNIYMLNSVLEAYNESSLDAE